MEFEYESYVYGADRQYKKVTLTSKNMIDHIYASSGNYHAVVKYIKSLQDLSTATRNYSPDIAEHVQHIAILYERSVELLNIYINDIADHCLKYTQESMSLLHIPTQEPNCSCSGFSEGDVVINKHAYEMYILKFFAAELDYLENNHNDVGKVHAKCIAFKNQFVKNSM